jgi:drug/metabolite transporter (DMT)-like permease
MFFGPYSFSTSKEAITPLLLSGVFGLLLGSYYLYKSIKTIGLTKTAIGLSLTGPLTMFLESAISGTFPSSFAIGASLLTTISLIVASKAAKDTCLPLTKNNILYLTLCIVGNSFSFLFISLVPTDENAIGMNFFRFLPCFLFAVAYVTYGTSHKPSKLNIGKIPLKIRGALIMSAVTCSLLGQIFLAKSVVLAGSGISSNIVMSHFIWTGLAGKFIFKEDRSPLIYVSLALNTIGLIIFSIDKTKELF